MPEKQLFPLGKVSTADFFKINNHVNPNSIRRMGMAISQGTIACILVPRDEDPDPVFIGPPDPDPTCNNGFIKLFLS